MVYNEETKKSNCYEVRITFATLKNLFSFIKLKFPIYKYIQRGTLFELQINIKKLTETFLLSLEIP